jgi:archaemetzincin
MKIMLLALGEVDITAVDAVINGMASVFGCPVSASGVKSLLKTAFDPDRGQYLSDSLIKSLPRPAVDEKEIVLGICNADIYTGDMNFIFGQADRTTGRAMVSAFRLGPSRNDSLFKGRIIKEAVHEVGHLLGLDHCPDTQCVMHFSNTLQDTDNKSGSFCHKCRPRLLI